MRVIFNCARMAYTEGWLIFMIALGSAIFSEAVNWLFVYRTATYKNLRSNIDKATKKCELVLKSLVVLLLICVCLFARMWV